MNDPSMNKMKSLGLLLLTILTLGIFKSVYRRLYTPFRQLFLLFIATGYSFLIALGLFCAIAYELQIITDHFQGMKAMLTDPRFGYTLFTALFLSVWVTLLATLSWYFNEQTLWERTLSWTERFQRGLKRLTVRAK